LVARTVPIGMKIIILVLVWEASLKTHLLTKKLVWEIMTVPSTIMEKPLAIGIQPKTR